MAELAVFLAWVLAAILIAAALAKILSKRHPTSSVAIAVIEGALGALLVAGFAPRLIAAAAAVVFGAYVAYAFWLAPEERCQCFGDRLPSTSVVSQRVRNVLILALAVALVSLKLISLGPPTAVALYASIGVLIGLVIVASPWAFDWARGL